jgi:hypothetical protein
VSTAGERARCLALGASLATAVARSRRWALHLGSTIDESLMRLPGDELMSRADLMATRTVQIGAPAKDVWPWLAQLGQGQGGFYSYDGLENLCGCAITSADHICAMWQSVAVGDDFRLHPRVRLTVARVDPGRALVVRGGVPMGSHSPPYDFTWAFVVEQESNGTSTLIVRERYSYSRWWAPLIVEPAALVSSVMSAKMLRRIRALAENAELHRPATRPQEREPSTT